MNAPELRDIQLPDADLWWPLAPGWWLLLLMLIMLLVALPRLLRWWRYQPPRRLAQQQLAQIRKRHESGSEPELILREVAALLRRVSISYYGRHDGAALTGQAWCQQLQALAPAAVFDEALMRWLSLGRYQPAAKIEVEPVLSACERWLRHLPRSRQRVSV